MPTIGPHVCNWTLLLLLCTSPILSQSTNETAVPQSSSTSVQPTVVSITSISSNVAPPASKSTTTPSFSSETTCLFRTINYITHTLPQQCLKTTWSAPSPTGSSENVGAETDPSPTPMLSIPWIADRVVNDTSIGSETQPPSGATAQTPSIQTESTNAETSSASLGSDTESETDSPLDNDNFMSFEDWKKKILAKAGQSPENVGQGRSAPDSGNRRRPVNVNDLDSLGEDAEIEIDFGGFVNTGGGEKPVRSSRGVQDSPEASEGSEDGEKPDPSSFALSKDAGKTCKERFNYASFDCAATVLKTNREAKSSSSILVENKDSYMLNVCSAQNKFLIVELCDDILVDTVVLANYEFFSSMFRHFRVSVSDRYPPASKTGWKVLGTFEGRNSRDLQPFLVTEPQIWARYLRVELLTHYGNEFYCPVSLLRVHGTTMFEQFKREQEEGRGDDEFVEQIEAGEPEPETTASAMMDDVKASELADMPPQAGKNTEFVQDEKTQGEDTSESENSQGTVTSTSTVQPEPQQVTESTQASPTQSADSRGSVSSSNSSQGGSESLVTSPVSAPNSAKVSSNIDSKPIGAEQGNSSTATASNISSSNMISSSAGAPSSSQTVVPTANGSQKEKTTSMLSKNETSSTPAGASTNNTQSQSQPQQRVSSHTQPHPPSPTTQESFFKSVHKRLQQLEANSTLSLQYIEEQSRILRDAFIKVEKRQLAKIETFLVHLNNTAIQELKSYKALYEQIWQSTVLELDSIKERNQREMGELGSRLTLIADELVWQKRMAVIQSTLLLLCLALVLFVRSGHVGPAQLDIPIAQQTGSKYARIFDTPPESPEANGRRRRGISRMWRSETSATSERSGHSGHQSDGINPSDAETDGLRSPVQIEFSPPTPTTGGTFSDAGHGSSPGQSSNLELRDSDEKEEQDNGSAGSAELDDQAEIVQQLATQSGPATPRGSRDSRPSWQEADRALGVLKAEDDQEPAQTLGTKRDKERRKKRSPLRRVESYDGEAGDSPGDDSGGDIMFAG